MPDERHTDGNDGAYVLGDTVDVIGKFTNYLLPTSDATVTLISTSPFVDIVENTADVGVINTNETKENDQEPFRIVILPGTPQN